MTAKVRVEMIPAGVAELLRSPGVAAELHRCNEPVLDTARATAPVRTGAYRDGLQIEDVIEETAVSRVGSTVPYSIYVQAETGNLARALDAAG